MGQGEIIEGVMLTPLKKITGPLGNVYHGMKQPEKSFAGFGEAYFSTVKSNMVKGWKKHTKMVSNLIVPVGAIRFVIYDDRLGSSTFGQVMDITLSLRNYQRLTIPPNLWMGFQGRGERENMLLNISSIGHDPVESFTEPLDSTKIPFTEW